jgi:hypothetical protein
MFYYNLSREGFMRYLSLIVSLTTWMGLAALSHAAEPLPSPKGPVILTISGNIEQANGGGQAQFDKAMLESLGMASFTTGSEVSNRPQLFEGVPLRAVLDRVGARGSAMRASALNDYETTIPFNDLRFEPLLALKVDGQILTVRDKGPLWIVYPRDAHKELHDVKYYSRSVWQLNKLHVE